MIEEFVIPSARELEYLLRIVESAAAIHTRPELFLWAQGQFQALLPHQVMVALQFGPDDDVLHSVCLHGAVLAPALTEQLVALSLRLARHCRSLQRLPCLVPHHGATTPALSVFRPAIEALAPGNVLVHSSAPLFCGAATFVLFGMPATAPSRHKYFMNILLPCLQAALQRQVPLAAVSVPIAAAPLLQTLSGREIEVVDGIRQGKRNEQIGVALGISTNTVKNHVSNIYRKLGVQNRMQAVTRALALALIEHGA